MRMTRLHAPTLKENPKDAEVVSHQLLSRGGYIRKLAAGIYDYLPLARRVLRKIEQIVREEMDAADAQEVLLPIVQPASIWEESGRWGVYGPELLRMKDRKGGAFCLGPTHEEVMVDLVRRDVSSWRALPLNLYQIQAKFRDEIRPRAGLMRGREFIMKDAYSFDVDVESALASYERMFAAYQRIFERCGLEFRAVEADSGAIGGSRSHEFQVLADSGEDAIVSCPNCEYAANVEQAELAALKAPEAAESAPKASVDTPDVRSIEAVAQFLGRSPQSLIKTLIYWVDGALHAVLMRGDHEANEIKIKRLFDADEVRLATEAETVKATGAPVGFAGPVALPAVESIVADHCLEGARNLAAGGNAVDTHLVNLDVGRDFDVSQFADLRLASGGDACVRCGSELRPYRGIEVGHVFYLGTKYSEAMKCTVLDQQGKQQSVVMGCYGIGVSRIMAAAVEQNHDASGIIWPLALAPYSVAILPLQMNKPDVVEAAETLYLKLKEAGVEVLLDDRKERAGGKFKDAELIGAPWRVAIGGRGLANGVVELKGRSESEATEVPVDDIVGILLGRLSE